MALVTGLNHTRELLSSHGPSRSTISFVLVALSGLALFHPALFWLTNLLGGGPWTRVLHPFIGLIMVGAFIQFAAKYWKENALQPRDWEWLRKIRDVIENKDDKLPEVGRYNAGQKLLYFTIVACLAVLSLQLVRRVERHHRHLRDGARLAVVIVHHDVAIRLCGDRGKRARGHPVLGEPAQIVRRAGVLRHAVGLTEGAEIDRDGLRARAEVRSE